VALTVSATHGYNNVPALLKWLDKYPYGCIEQTTSRAMPLLVFNDLSDLAGLPRDQALRPRVQDAIDAVLDMQNYRRQFRHVGAGLDADPWISVFALDFLYQAKDKGYVVPNDALKRGAAWLRTAAASDSNDDNDARLCLLCAGAHGPGEPLRPALFQRHARAGDEHRDRRGADRRRRRRRPATARARATASAGRATSQAPRATPSPIRRTITARCCATRGHHGAGGGERRADLVPALLKKAPSSTCGSTTPPRRKRPGCCAPPMR
jgi:hypothetical protein